MERITAPSTHTPLTNSQCLQVTGGAQGLLHKGGQSSGQGAVPRRARQPREGDTTRSHLQVGKRRLEKLWSVSTALRPLAGDGVTPTEAVRRRADPVLPGHTALASQRTQEGFGFRLLLRVPRPLALLQSRSQDSGPRVSTGIPTHPSHQVCFSHVGKRSAYYFSSNLPDVNNNV